MDPHHRTLRIGAAAILCAFVFRLFSSGLPEKITSWLNQPNTAAFLIYLETGRDVRFSVSSEVFLNYASESPPPWVPETTPETIPETLPAFSGEDAALIEMYQGNRKNPDIEALLLQPLSWDLTVEEPTVLILHTHTTESYTKSGESYVESSSWRTLDENYNMLSIGDRVVEILAEHGITALHDRELHDYPSYNGSYTHARASMESYLEQYPSIRMVLDLHRDASESSFGRQLRTVANLDSGTSAQLMLVMGTNYDTWEENLSLGLKLQAQLEKQAPGITRPTILRTSRFNQDLCPGALLVEVGAAGNSHSEAILAAEELAKAIVTLAKGTE